MDFSSHTRHNWDSQAHTVSHFMGEVTTDVVRELPPCSVTGKGRVPTLLCIQTRLYTTQMLCCNVPSNMKLLQILSHQ